MEIAYLSKRMIVVFGVQTANLDAKENFYRSSGFLNLAIWNKYWIIHSQLVANTISTITVILIFRPTFVCRSLTMRESSFNQVGLILFFSSDKLIRTNSEDDDEGQMNIIDIKIDRTFWESTHSGAHLMFSKHWQPVTRHVCLDAKIEW